MLQVSWCHNRCDLHMLTPKVMATVTLMVRIQADSAEWCVKGHVFIMRPSVNGIRPL